MSIDPIVTRVAHTGTHELCFRGRRVFAQLLGNASVGQMVVLGLAGRWLDEQEVRVIDDIVTVMSSADPRLWPFKITRLASSYGRASAGVAATLVAGEGGMYGADRVFAIATWLEGLARRADAFTDDEMHHELATQPPGFAVVGRSHDERFAALVAHLDRRGHQGGRHLRLLYQAVRVGRDRQRLEPHIYLAVAALCLDLGLSSHATAMLGVLVLFHDALANGAEGALQQPIHLQLLPSDRLAYRGRAARVSPRARTATGGDVP